MKKVEPCATCPYRKSTPVGLWHPVEYAGLVQNDTDRGNVFGCHYGPLQKEQGPCIGWLADQKRRGIPNIGLRMLLMAKPKMAKIFRAVNECDPDLYDSIEEMVVANSGKKFPKKTKAAKSVLRIRAAVEKAKKT